MNTAAIPFSLSPRPLIRYNLDETMRLVALIVSVTVFEAVAAHQPSIDHESSCHSLPLVEIDIEVLKRSNPFIIFRSTYDFHNCTTVVYTPTECGKPVSTGTAVLIRPDCMYTYSLQELENKQWISTITATKKAFHYRGVYLNINGTSCAFCIAECVPDGTTCYGALCLGKTKQDEAEIQEFIDRKLKAIPGIKNTYQGCPST